MKKQEKKRAKKSAQVKGAPKMKPKKVKRLFKLGKEKQYSVESLKAALNAIDKGVTIREAANHYNVPKSTLHAKQKFHSPLECSKGPAPVLTTETESIIVNWILYCAEKGFPVTKSQLLDTIQKYLKEEKIKTVFTDDRPGEKWYKAFMLRNPNLSHRVSQNLTSTRAAVSEEDLRKWFDYVKAYLEKKSLLNIEPSRIFNLDESAFLLVPKDKNVITRRGAKNAYKIVSRDDKKAITVLFIASAEGTLLPPMVLYNCKTSPRKDTLSKIPKGWLVGNTETGWMTAENFFFWVQKGFIPWLNNNNVQLPVVLYLDGHVSHLSLPLMKLCVDNQIELICLHANATHIYQPLDVSVFHPLKDTYRDTLRSWRIENDVVDMKKNMFAPILDLTLKSIDLSAAIKNGFRSCGLYPFDADAVNYNILNKGNKGKKQKTSHESPANSSEISNKQVLHDYETKILSAEVLKIFKQHYLEEIWSGDAALKSHFDFWKQLLTLSDKEASNLGNTEESLLQTAKDTGDSTLSIDNNTEDIPDKGFDDVFEDNLNRDNMSQSAIILGRDLDGNDVYLAEEDIVFDCDFLLQNEHDNTNLSVGASEEVPSSNTNDQGNYEDSEDILFNSTNIVSVDHGCNAKDSEINSQETIQSSPMKNDEEVNVVPDQVNLILDMKAQEAENINLVIEQRLPVRNNEECIIVPGQVNSSIESNGQETETNCLVTTQRLVIGDNKELTTTGDLTYPNDTQDEILDLSSKNSNRNSSGSKIKNPFFSVPTFSKCKVLKKGKSRESEPVAVVDDLLKVLQKKEDDKIKIKKEVLGRKILQEKNRVLKEKHENIHKVHVENTRQLSKEKKDVKKLIKEYKTAVKSKNSKENKKESETQIKILELRIDEIDRLIAIEKLNAVQSRITIKQEKID